MRILFICHEYPPKPFGGIGSFTKLIAEKLAEKGNSVCVIGYGETDSKSIQIENGVEVVRLANPKQSTKKFIRIFNEFKNRWIFQRNVKKQALKFQAEIIETYEWTGPLLFKPKGAKLVVRLHGSNTANNEYMGKKRSKLVAFFERRTLKIADSIVSVSDHISEITKKSFNIRIATTTIYNGINLNIFKVADVERNKEKILMVGRMHPYKGFEQLFDAMNYFFKNNATVYFEFACSIIPAYKDHLMNKVDNEYHHRIHFIGRIPNEDLYQLYSSANLTILPSLSEACPIIPLESMACETPVIMSNRFSSKEIIEQGVDGFLVEVMDPIKFANQIIDILSDQDSIEKMRSKARNKIVKNFEIENIIETNRQFYTSILKDA